MRKLEVKRIIGMVLLFGLILYFCFYKIKNNSILNQEEYEKLELPDTSRPETGDLNFEI